MKYFNKIRFKHSTKYSKHNVGVSIEVSISVLLSVPSFVVLSFEDDFFPVIIFMVCYVDAFSFRSLSSSLCLTVRVLSTARWSLLTREWYQELFFFDFLIALCHFQIKGLNSFYHSFLITLNTDLSSLWNVSIYLLRYLGLVLNICFYE